MDEQTKNAETQVDTQNADEKKSVESLLKELEDLKASKSASDAQAETLKKEVAKLKSSKKEADNSLQKESDSLKQEISELRAKLQDSTIKSSLAERHLVAQDDALVSSMVKAKMSDGKDASTAVAELYASHPYLFKGAVAKIAEEKASAAKIETEKKLNDRFVSSAIERLKRSVLSPIGE